MKTISKNIAIAGLATVMTTSLAVGLTTLPGNTASADTGSKTIATNYFYDNLTIVGEDGKRSEFTLARKFYKALEAIYEAGDFKDGVVEYDLTGKDIVSTTEIEAYVKNGDFTIPRAFGAARDAFLTDHPDLFYVDFYKLTISVMTKNGEYHAFIDSGREANVYYDNGFRTEAEVDEAITNYNNVIDEIVADALAAQAADPYSARDVYLAKWVNQELVNRIDYDYVAYDNKDDPDAVTSAYINTPYGGLVNGKAVCGGFSTSYKVIMDRLEIPCITVNGYSNSKDENGRDSSSNVYHMWNYVWLENPSAGAQRSYSYADASNGEGGEWYAVDVTWNNSSVYKHRYMTMNDKTDALYHVNDGVISSSGYELTYPKLSTHNYGSSGETDGMQYSIVYNETGYKDDYGNPLVENRETISYNGKSALRLLEEDGLHLAYRLAQFKNGELVWTQWMELAGYYEYINLTTSEAYAGVTDDGNETTLLGNSLYVYTQFCVLETAPDIFQNVNGQGINKDIYVLYSDESKPEEHTMDISEVHVNQSYGTYTPPPYVHSGEPNFQVEQEISDGMRDKSITDKVIMDEKYAFDIKITYNEELHVLDESEDIKVTFTAQYKNAHEYAKFLPVNETGAKVELLSDKKTLRFRFMPSLMYEHNRMGYTFTFTNVGSAEIVNKVVRDADGNIVKDENGNPVTEPVTSDKLPNTVYYNFSRVYYQCPKYFGYDGRLYISCCAQPTLVDNSDLSANDFVDENGDSNFSENQKSQMMLVVNKVTEGTEETMLDEIAGSDEINLEKDDIKTSQTYDIRLQVCNKYPTISDGSYVKIALGFPEGYGPDDEGVTFKIFHRKHVKGDEYIIEEIPCVVTQFGIVAVVNSFSPYMVAVVDADKVTDKSVYTSVEGKGGKVSVADSTGAIRKLADGNDSYVCDVTPDEGYQVYSVTLNGVEVKDRLADNKLTLSFDELDGNNEVEVKFISDAAANRIQSKVENEGYTVVDPVKIVVPVDGLYPTPSVDNVVSSANTVAGIIVIVVAVAAVAVAITATVIIVKRRKNEG